MIRRRQAACATALIPAALLAGCRSFEAPAKATLARLRPMQLAERLELQSATGQGRFTLELTSSALSGVFDAVWAVDERALRLQLFPDVGAKVFELRITTQSIEADTPVGTYRAVVPFDAAEPHLALVLAELLLELRSPLHDGRVDGERGGDAGEVELRLRPALGAGSVVAALGDSGRIVRYRFELGWLAFTLLADGSFSGRGFSGRLCP